MAVARPVAAPGDLPPDAPEDARDAASSAGVQVRSLRIVEEMDEVVGLFDRVWDCDGVPAIPMDLLRALAYAGNYVAGAYDEQGLVGASVGFTSATEPRLLHSHMTGVAPRGQSRGVGYALKLHQRAWALERGLETISWTFDPLVGRNARFNISKLGARVTCYLRDFYGPLVDGLNAGDTTDRLLVEWTLTKPLPTQPADADLRLLPAWVAAGPNGAVVRDHSAAPVISVATPSDVTRLRQQQPAAAAAWRAAVRDALEVGLEAGYEVTGVTRAGTYVLSRRASA